MVRSHPDSFSFTWSMALRHLSVPNRRSHGTVPFLGLKTNCALFHYYYVLIIPALANDLFLLVGELASVVSDLHPEHSGGCDVPPGSVRLPQLQLFAQCFCFCFCCSHFISKRDLGALLLYLSRISLAKKLRGTTSQRWNSSKSCC
jgi:hypothetical protein